MLGFILERLSWATAFTMVIAFFLPWLKAKDHRPMDYAHSELKKQELVEEANRSWVETYFTLGDNEIHDALTDALSGTSGFKLLLLARSDSATDRETARKMVSFLGSVEPREASVLIYAVPAFALIGACFCAVATRGRWIFLIPLGLCVLLYALMRTRINETYLDRLVLDLSAGIGLWISLYGLLVMILILTLRTLVGLTQK